MAWEEQSNVIIRDTDLYGQQEIKLLIDIKTLDIAITFISSRRITLLEGLKWNFTNTVVCQELSEWAPK